MTAVPGAPSRQGDVHLVSKVNVGGVDRWLSGVGGSALLLAGLARRSFGGLALAATGGYFLYRAITRYCYFSDLLGIDTARQAAALPATRGITVEESVTVNRPRHEVYCYWRDLTNLPRFMKHLESVTSTGPGRSHWVANAPLGAKVEWDAEVINDLQDEMIAWRSLGDASVTNSGMIRFADAPDGRSTEVKVLLEYTPPAGVVGVAFAKLFGEEPSQQVAADLRRFKQVLEAGEAPTTEGQPAGAGRKIGDEFFAERHQALDRASHGHPVQEASEESFPASDAPAWTGRNQGTSPA